MSDTPLFKKMAVSACIGCCALNLVIVFGAGTGFSGLATINQSPATLVAVGLALVGAAYVLIWRRSRKLSCCEAVKN